MMELEAPAALASQVFSELEVVAMVGSDLPVSSDRPHEIEPLAPDELDQALHEHDGPVAGDRRPQRRSSQ